MPNRLKRVKNSLRVLSLDYCLLSSPLLSSKSSLVILFNYQGLLDHNMAEFIDYTKFNQDLGLKAGTESLGGIFSTILPYVITIAGLVLFGMLIGGGFTMLAGAADKESQEKGKKMITSALVGFIIIFLSYWLAQILQVIFKVSIVS